MVDEFNHESPGIHVLTRPMSVHGAPTYLRYDGGPELVSNAILHWLTDARIETGSIDPGKPEFKQHHPPTHDHPNRAISQE